MPLIFGLIGFIFATFLALAWIAVWLVGAITGLLWPLALLVLGALMWRRGSGSFPKEQRQHTRPTSAEPVNSAFDDYRAETLRRLDEERERFREFIERLRRSKDKEAFERFMAERRSRRTPGPQRLIPQR